MFFIKEINQHYIYIYIYFKAFRDKSCFPFYCGGQQVGLVRKDVAEEVLENHKDVFEVP